MCGLMSKLAMLILLRLLLGGHCTNITVACIAIALGTISALWGVLFALMERDLKRVLAYSSVENMGLILMAIGLAMLAGARGLTVVQDIATAAAIFHIVNHALFKALLFLGAASVERSAHTRDMAVLGGIAKQMPWTMLCFFIGAIAICAMPPLNGFASKWLLYQSFFRLSFEHAPLIERAVAMGMVGILAFVGGLSLAAYTKAVGIAFLGRPRSALASRAKESKENSPDGLIMAQILLACSCLMIGMLVPFVLNFLSPAIAQLTAHPGLVGSSLFPLPQGELCFIGAITVGVIYLFILGRKSADIRSYITWDCGFGPTSARSEETGSSFSHPIGRIFSQVLQLKVTTEITGKDRRHFPELVKVATNMSPIVETKFYNPAMKLLNWISSSLARIQTGSIHIHLLYVFLTMVLLVFLGTHI
jgi:NADH:ubiquinone oxidoreductase subunit 5 (subunit L)/multisubunit Na+/H+ antiporter MnhA subunit